MANLIKWLARSTLSEHVSKLYHVLQFLLEDNYNQITRYKYSNNRVI